MRIGLPTTLFFKDRLEVAIEEIIDSGSDCVEIVCESYHFPPDSLTVSDKIFQMLENEDIYLTIHASFFDINLGSYYPEVRDFSVKKVKQSIDLADSLGSDLVTIHPGYFLSPGHREMWEELKRNFHESLEECLEYSRERDVKMGLENIQVPYFFYSSMEKLGPFVKNKDNLGITLDIAHSYLLKRRNDSKNPEEDISEEIKKFGESIEHVHIHDNAGGGDNHLPPGEGEINFTPIVQALKEINYDNRVIVEVHRADKPLEAGREALKAAETLLE